jgi:D-alanyl-D-alanine carboxypeptidase
MAGMIIIRVSVLLAALGLCAVPVLADTGLQSRLQTVVDEYHTANPAAPGVVIHVTSPSLGLDWEYAVGTAGREIDEPLTARHTFRIASNTKTYVAAAVLRLAELGKLSLDDPLGRHLEQERYELLAGDGYDLETMTLGQVLAHTSGLFEHPADPRYAAAILADPHHHWTREEQIAKCVEWGDPVGAPGEKFSYSDTGYIILGGIIEKMTGRNLGGAVRQLLDFERLGLNATWWETLEDKPATAGGRAHQYYGDEDTIDWNPSLDLYGGGGLICDVRDLSRFTRLLLQGKVLHEESSLAAMTGTGTESFRLGLIVLDLGRYLGWGHSGFWNTFVYHVPTLDLTVSGCILNHFAEKGQELAKRLVAVVAEE